MSPCRRRHLCFRATVPQRLLTPACGVYTRAARKHLLTSIRAFRLILIAQKSAVDRMRACHLHTQSVDCIGSLVQAAAAGANRPHQQSNRHGPVARATGTPCAGNYCLGVLNPPKKTYSFWPFPPRFLPLECLPGHSQNVRNLAPALRSTECSRHKRTTTRVLDTSFPLRCCTSFPSHGCTFIILACFTVFKSTI